MSDASNKVLELVTQPSSPAQIRERREAEQPHTDLVATLDGKLVEPASSPTATARPRMVAPPQTID